MAQVDYLHSCGNWIAGRDLLRKEGSVKIKSYSQALVWMLIIAAYSCLVVWLSFRVFVMGDA